MDKLFLKKLCHIAKKNYFCSDLMLKHDEKKTFYMRNGNVRPVGLCL